MQEQHDQDDFSFDDDAILGLDGEFCFDDEDDEAASGFFAGGELIDQRRGAPSMTALSCSDIPERVRFSVAAKVRVEGRPLEGAGAGVILNLSISGAACLLPMELERGERLWLHFALGLGEAPLDMLAQVVWRRELDDGGLVYGVHFASLTAEEEQRIEATVRERSEGRAGAWPLPMPLMPVEEESLPKIESRGSELSALFVAGVSFLAGMGVALFLALLANGLRDAPVQDASSEYSLLGDGAVAVDVAIPADTVAFEVGAAANRESEVFPAPVLLSKPEPAAAVVPELPESDDGPAQMAPQDAASDLLPRKAKAEAVEQGDVLRLLGQESFELALHTDGPVGDVKAFWLTSPRRLVVDVGGRKSGFSRVDYKIEHPLASRLRVGSHPDKVRFVIETVEEIDNNVQLTPHANAIVVALARR